jgi:hypothetical protein
MALRGHAPPQIARCMVFTSVLIIVLLAAFSLYCLLLGSPIVVCEAGARERRARTHNSNTRGAFLTSPLRAIFVTTAPCV